MLAVGAASMGCSDVCEPSEGTLCTVVGTGEAGFSGDGADARTAELYQPMDVTVGPDGRVFVVDWNNHRIRVVDDDHVITTVAGTGDLGDGPVGPALEADFNHPTSVTFDGEGRMWIAAWHNSRIRRIDLEGGVMDDVCGTGARAYAGDGGPAGVAVLDLPAGIVFDADQNLIVVDQANQVLRRINADDGTIERIAGQCVVVDGCPAGGTPTQCPGSDKLSCDMEMCARPCAGAFGGDGGDAMEARFSMPFGQSADPAGRVALDVDGNLFLADTRNHRIRRIGTDGVVTTIAGDGERGSTGDGVPATEARLDNPVDLDFGPDGTLYIADTFNSCIRAVGTDGIIRTVAGVCGQRGDASDGEAADEGLLDRPSGLDVDGELLYIADTLNHRIRVVGLGE
jgi:adhesin/invasin